MTAYEVYSYFLNLSKIVDYEALKPEPISLVETVKALRNQRHPWMVEGESQYKFAYSYLSNCLKYIHIRKFKENVVVQLEIKDLTYMIK